MTGPEPMARSPEVFAYTGPHGLAFRPFGRIMRQSCPVCGSRDIGNVFKLPMSRIDPPITVFGGYFNEIPTLNSPFEIFAWDLCRRCNSIFLNPAAPRERINANYRASESYLKKMVDQATWSAHEERYEALMRFAPPAAGNLVDAACGGGHTLFLAQRDRARHWNRLVGLELSEAYVANLRQHGIEAYQFDLDRDDHRSRLGAGSIDLVSFQEAFEHVERPLAVMAKLLDLLREGGRLYFSAQRYGQGCNLPILAGEPIYIGPRLIDLLPEMLPCTVVDVEKYGPRYLIAIERTAQPVGEAQLAIGIEAVPAATALPEQRTSRMPIPLKPPFERELGFCFTKELSECADPLRELADCPEAPRRSRLVLLENGAPIGEAHAVHDDIRQRGSGRFSHWEDTLYFSTSDNSDPNRNAREYALAQVA